MNDLRQLVDGIRAQFTDPAKAALAIRVSLDFAALQARAAGGEDVTKELAIVEATARNLDEHARGVIGQQFMAWTQGMVAKALGVAIAGA